MKKFLVLYMASGADSEQMMQNSTPEQRQKGMEVWMKWMGDNKASLVDGGAPLGKTKRVDSQRDSDTKSNIGGYSIVQADSVDAAIRIFGKDHRICKCRAIGSKSSRSCRSGAYEQEGRSRPFLSRVLPQLSR